MRARLLVQRSAFAAVCLLGAADVCAQGGSQPPATVPVTRLDDRGTGADLDAPGAVSLTIAQPLPIREALLLLVTGTPFSLVVGDEVDGTFSGELKDLSMRQALEAVLFPRGLDYTIDRTLIRVHPLRPAMRVFDVSFLDIRRDWQRTIRSASSPGDAAGTGLTSSASASFFDEIEKGVNAILSSTGQAYVDRHSGVVQVTDLPERLDRVAVYLETVHLRAVRQVRLEARVFEVTLSSPEALSLDWRRVAALSGEAWDMPAGGLVGVTVSNFDNVLKAVATQGTVRMLAVQQVVAMNNEPALMRVGTQDVYFTTTASPGSGGGTDRTTAPVPVHEGLTMTVTPQIAADGIIQLNVAPTITERTGEARSRQGERVPVLSIAEADTLVRLRDGQTVMLSGFLQERTNTNQAEGIAGFFGSRKEETVRAELVILLKATVVTPGAPAPGGTR